MEPEWAEWARKNMPPDLYAKAEGHWQFTGAIMKKLDAENQRLREALLLTIRELDDIIDQKGHTARTRDVLAKARAEYKGGKVMGCGTGYASLTTQKLRQRVAYWVGEARRMQTLARECGKENQRLRETLISIRELAEGVSDASL